MKVEEHTTLVSATSILAAAIEQYGLDLREIAEEVGIDLSQPLRPHDRISYIKLQKAWQLAVEKSGDNCFGLTVGTLTQPLALSGLGYSFIASDTLKEAILRFVRYQRMISTVLDYQCEEKGETYSLQCNYLPPEGSVVSASIDAAVAFLVQMCRNLMGTTGLEFSPESVSFQHPLPLGQDSYQRFQHFFDAPVIFGAKRNEIIISKEDMELELPVSNPELARINDSVVVEYLKKFDKNDIVTQTRAIIIEELPSGAVLQHHVAKVLNFSLRNFQRRLKEKGTSFSKLQDAIRQELAVQYLTEGHRQIIEVAFLLGFSNSSSFTRAFKRWMGVTPQQYAATN